MIWILFLVLLLFLFSLPIKEPYYTLFYPGEQHQRRYEDLDYNLLHKHYTYKDLTIGVHTKDETFMKNFTRLIVAEAPYRNVHLKLYHWYHDVVKHLMNHTIQIGLIPTPYVKHRFYFIGNVGKIYCFILSHSHKVGILGIPQDFKFIYDDLELPYEHKTSTFHTIVQDFTSQTLESMFYCGKYPSDFLDSLQFAVSYIPIQTHKPYYYHDTLDMSLQYHQTPNHKQRYTSMWYQTVYYNLSLYSHKPMNIRFLLYKYKKEIPFYYHHWNHGKYEVEYLKEKHQLTKPYVLEHFI